MDEINTFQFYIFQFNLSIIYIVDFKNTKNIEMTK